MKEGRIEARDRLLGAQPPMVPFEGKSTGVAQYRRANRSVQSIREGAVLPGDQRGELHAGTGAQAEAALYALQALQRVPGTTVDDCPAMCLS